MPITMDAKQNDPWISDPPFLIWLEEKRLKFTKEIPQKGAKAREELLFVGIGGSISIGVVVLYFGEMLLLWGLCLTLPAAIIGLFWHIRSRDQHSSIHFNTLAILDLYDGWWHGPSGEPIASLSNTHLKVTQKKELLDRMEAQCRYMFQLNAEGHSVDIYETLSEDRNHTIREKLASHLADIENISFFWDGKTQ